MILCQNIFRYLRKNCFACGAHGITDIFTVAFQLPVHHFVLEPPQKQNFNLVFEDWSYVLLIGKAVFFHFPVLMACKALKLSLQSRLWQKAVKDDENFSDRMSFADLIDINTASAFCCPRPISVNTRISAVLFVHVWLDESYCTLL